MESSGLSVSLSKISLIRINLSMKEVGIWEDKFKSQVKSFPINYLGFPLGGVIRIGVGEA